MSSYIFPKDARGRGLSSMPKNGGEIKYFTGYGVITTILSGTDWMYLSDGVVTVLPNTSSQYRVGVICSTSEFGSDYVIVGQDYDDIPHPLFYIGDCVYSPLDSFPIVCPVCPDSIELEIRYALYFEHGNQSIEVRINSTCEEIALDKVSIFNSANANLCVCKILIPHSSLNRELIVDNHVLINGLNNGPNGTCDFQLKILQGGFKKCSDIKILKMNNGLRHLYNLKNNKIKKGSYHNLKSGDGVIVDGVLYILD